MQGGDERIGALDGRRAIAIQRQCGSVVDVLHAANEHVAQVVERVRRLYRKQSDRQRHALVWLQGLHACGIERPRLIGKMAHFHRWDAGQCLSANGLGGQPPVAGDQIAQMRQSRVASIRFELIPVRNVVRSEMKSASSLARSSSLNAS